MAKPVTKCTRQGIDSLPVLGGLRGYSPAPETRPWPGALRSYDLFIDGKFTLVGELMDRLPRVRLSRRRESPSGRAAGNSLEGQSATRPCWRPTNRLGL